jgi:hypothetical protein
MEKPSKTPTNDAQETALARALDRYRQATAEARLTAYLRKRGGSVIVRDLLRSNNRIYHSAPARFSWMRPRVTRSDGFFSSVGAGRTERNRTRAATKPQERKEIMASSLR